MYVSAFGSWREYLQLMDDISNIMGNITRLLALVGGGLAAVAIAYAGIQWMTASGDPQKMAQVRMGVIGVPWAA